MPPNFLHIRDALKVFAGATIVQDQRHIKPMHQHVALRLVLEGGFLPDEITPHPPLSASKRAGAWSLEFAPDLETSSELTVFGGMKTKQIDVVAAKEGVGPVLAVSIKGTFRAYRNLVNRMEEAIGDSTNVHVMYPGLVYGFLSLIRANRQSDGYSANDMGISADGTVSPQIQRYYAALCEMTGRKFVRNDYTRYEAVALVLVENSQSVAGEVCHEFPPSDMSLRLESFFRRLFEVYDLRFPLRADHIATVKRVSWRKTSPAIREIENQFSAPIGNVLGYVPRLDD